jgi:hypothetical protein
MEWEEKSEAQYRHEKHEWKYAVKLMRFTSFTKQEERASEPMVYLKGGFSLRAAFICCLGIPSMRNMYIRHTAWWQQAIG